jgi:CheY-like chemotaxis protein
MLSTISRTAVGSRTSPVALIVEYHPWLRFVLANLLQGIGFEVLLASNGGAGLRLAARLRPELVIVGDSLPELPPEQLIAELESRPADRGARVVRAHDLLRHAVEGEPVELPARQAASGQCRRMGLMRALCPGNSSRPPTAARGQFRLNGG